MGGLAANESTLGYIRARVKRHRWHKRVLKSNDPVIFSVSPFYFLVRLLRLLNECVNYSSTISPPKDWLAQISVTPRVQHRRY
jgi:40S ribosome biogenesis protein Tsr1 and BMS1 C-terminal